MSEIEEYHVYLFSCWFCY